MYINKSRLCGCLYIIIYIYILYMHKSPSLNPLHLVLTVYRNYSSLFREKIFLLPTCRTTYMYTMYTNIINYSKFPNRYCRYMYGYLRFLSLPFMAKTSIFILLPALYTLQCTENNSPNCFCSYMFATLFCQNFTVIALDYIHLSSGQRKH